MAHTSRPRQYTPFVAGPAISRRHQEEVGRAAAFLAQGRALSPEAASFPTTTERGLLGSIASQIGRKASAGNAADHHWLEREDEDDVGPVPAGSIDGT